MKSSTALKIVLDPFCYRQFDKALAGSSFVNYDRDAFTKKINAFYLSDKE
jgi:hypothetical protein